MGEKKRIWWTFQLWEADAFRQYLEEMALQGWFLEKVGGCGMKFYKAEPERRRYAALLVPESSSLTGADSWKAEQFRRQCQESGWMFQCSGTYWQIFYTTDDTVELAGDMAEEKQFRIQKSLSWNWSVKIFYPILIVLEIWALYYNLQNPGKMFADPMQLFLNLLLVGICISWTISYVQLFRWNHGNTMALKKGTPFPRMDLKRKINLKKRTVVCDGILILLVLALAFSSSMRVLAGFLIYSILIVLISLLVRKLVRDNGSGDSRDEWISYLVGSAVLCMIAIPLSNAAADHFLGKEEADTGRKQTIFASYQTGDFRVSSSGKPVGVTIYASPIPWIIYKTSKCYPKDMAELWERVELEVPTELGELPDDVEVFWYRYVFHQEERKNVQGEAFSEETYEGETAVDEVILKDRSRLVVLDYGGGTDPAGVKEAVEMFGEAQSEVVEKIE